MDGGVNAACQPGRAEASVLLLHSRAQAQGPDNCVSFPSHRKVIFRGDVSSSPRVTAPPGDGRRAFVSSPPPRPPPSTRSCCPCVFMIHRFAKLASETKGVLRSRGYAEKRCRDNDLAHTCAHVLGDGLRCSQVCSQSASVRVIQWSWLQNPDNEIRADSYASQLKMTTGYSEKSHLRPVFVPNSPY